MRISARGADCQQPARHRHGGQEGRQCALRPPVSRQARRWSARDKAPGSLVAEPIGDLGKREPPVLQLAPSLHHLLLPLAKAAPSCWRKSRLRYAPRRRRQVRRAPAPGQAPSDEPLHLPSASSGGRAKARQQRAGLQGRQCGRRRHMGEPGAAQHASCLPPAGTRQIWPAISSSPSLAP